VKPSRRRAAVEYLCGGYGVSERRACGVARLALSTKRYHSQKDPQAALRIRIREIAEARIRYGYREIRVLLNREGWKVGKKRVYRLYREEGLILRQRPRRRRQVAAHQRERRKPRAPNEVWSLDFVADQLVDGRRFRALTVVDVFTRESLDIETGQNLKGESVNSVPLSQNNIFGNPRSCRIRFTHGSVGVSERRADRLLAAGQADRQAHVESFNGTFRAECLDTHWFTSLSEAKQIIGAWRREYNESRPHRALGERTPNEFAGQDGGFFCFD